MKKWTKRGLVTVLSALFLLSCVSTAWATETNPVRDGDSNFTKSKSGDTATDGITSFYLIKDYDSENPTGETAPKSNSPAETVTYTIKPYGVWNAGSTYSDSGTATKIAKTNMPMLTGTNKTGVTYTTSGRTLTVTQEVAIGAARKEDADINANDTKTAISLPEYSTVGDYWYEVKETIGVGSHPTTGVTYGTNSTYDTSNNGYNATYYLHVQVTETVTNADGQASSNKVSNVTLHTTAPDTEDDDAAYNNKTGTTYKTENKVNAIENLYSAGNLVIEKKVTGNAGDKTKYFPVTVTFTKPANTIVNSDITFTAALRSGEAEPYTYTNTAVTIKGQYYNDSETNTIRWQKDSSNASATEIGATATAVFYVKDNTTVTFSNIPYGITYAVSEVPDDYQSSMEFTNNSDDSASSFNGISLAADTIASGSTPASATGSISDASDTLTITNNKTMTIDTGVFTENLPFVITFIVAGAALFLLIARKKRGFEG